MNLVRTFFTARSPSLVGALICTFLGLLCWTYWAGGWLANLSYDLGYLVRPEVSVDGAVMVLLDDASYTRFDQNRERQWNREFHGQLVRRLVESHAKAVVFDVLFDLPGTNDTPLLQAIQAAGQAGVPVVVAGKLHEPLHTGGGQKLIPLAPFTNLQQVAAWGLAEHQFEDRIVRRHFPGTPDTPSMVWRAAQLTLTNLPAVPARRWINYYGPPRRSAPFCSYHLALQGQVPASFFSNQVVFVGSAVEVAYGAGRQPDTWPTPYSRWGGRKAPGVEITATVYLNLKQRDWLNQLPENIELLLFLAFGAAIGSVLPLCRPTTAAALAVVIGLAIAGVAFWSMWQKLVWFAWLAPAAVQAPAAVVWSVLCHTRRLKEEKDLLEQKISVLEPALEMAGTRPDLDAPTKVAATRSSPVSRPSSGLASSFDPAAPIPGAPIVPEHTLLRCVGKGAYGEVWLARNAIGLFHVAKVVYRAGFSSQEPFEREFRGIQKFMPVSRLHPGLVQILQVGRNEAAGYFYYVMEPADDANDDRRMTDDELRGSAGANLPSSFAIRDPESYLPRTLKLDLERRRYLPARECISLGLALTSALEFLHSHHLIHRDIKPANIIFVRGAAKLADIGLVTDIAATGTDATYIGTKGYIPPEGPGKPAADIFSLGRVLYEAATGLGGGDFPQLPDTLLRRPDHELLLDLNQIIVKASEDDLALRYSSAGQMRADLERLQNETDRNAANKSREGG